MSVSALRVQQLRWLSFVKVIRVSDTCENAGDCYVLKEKRFGPKSGFRTKDECTYYMIRVRTIVEPEREIKMDTKRMSSRADA